MPQLLHGRQGHGGYLGESTDNDLKGSVPFIALVWSSTDNDLEGSVPFIALVWSWHVS